MTFELEYSAGRWLAPLELVDELYDALLRLPAKGQNHYITLASRDSDVEICCATKQSRFVKEPYAYTEDQAKSKLSAWRDERGSSCCKSCDRGSDSGSLVIGPAAVSAASKAPMAPNSPKLLPATTEIEAVRFLRERGYVVAPPCPPLAEPGSITPPPPYALYLSSSQPVQSTTGETPNVTLANPKRKRDNDQIITPATDRLPTPSHGPDIATVAPPREGSGGPEIDDDGDGDDEEVVVISAPQRKKRKTKRSARNNPPQEPAPPPRCAKTKRGALTSTVSYEAVAELTGAGQETERSPPTDVQLESDHAVGDQPTGLTTSEGGQAVLLNAVFDPPPTSSPEEIGALNLLSLRISAPSTPSAEPAVNDGEDTLFIPEDPAVAPQFVQPASAPRIEDPISQAMHTNMASGQMGANEQEEHTAGARELSTENCRLYREFCENVSRAEDQWDHPSTQQGMAKLREREPLLQPTFTKCLDIARRTMGEGVIDEWRNFQEQGWRKRQRCGYDRQRPGRTSIRGDGSTLTNAADPARGEVTAEAYRRFEEATKARTNSWKARFQYRRAAVGLAIQYETYAKLRDKQPICLPGASQQDRSMLLRALFREMHTDWRDALPCDFTDRQAKERGYGSEWRNFNQTIHDGKRWSIFVDSLGLGALLLIDTSKNSSYIQRLAPIPIFAAWVNMIPSVRPDVREVATRVEGYFDGMEDPSFYAARKLRPLKLERRAYRACSPSEQFEFSGSEGRRTPTADPAYLTQLGDAAIYGENGAMDDFIQSSKLDDEDFPDLSTDFT